MPMRNGKFVFTIPSRPIVPYFRAVTEVREDQLLLAVWARYG